MAGPGPRGPKKGGGPGKPADRPKLLAATLVAARTAGATYEQLDDPRLLGMLAKAEVIAAGPPARPLDAEVKAALDDFLKRSAPSGPRKPQPTTLAAAHAAGFTAAELNGERERALLFTAEDVVSGNPAVDLEAYLRHAIAELRRSKTAEAAAATENGSRKALELQVNLLTAQADHAKVAQKSHKDSVELLQTVLGWVISAVFIAVIIGLGFYFFRYGKL